MTNHSCTYWLLGSILFNESKMQMDELNEKEERETIPYGTPKCLPLLYALQPYEGKVPLEISDWNVWNCELIPQNDYGLDFGSTSKFNHKLVTDLGSNIQVSLSPSLHILKPHLRKTTIALSITSDLFNFCQTNNEYFMHLLPCNFSCGHQNQGAWQLLQSCELFHWQGI